MHLALRGLTRRRHTHTHTRHEPVESDPTVEAGHRTGGGNVEAVMSGDKVISLTSSEQVNRPRLDMSEWFEVSLCIES